MFVHTHTLNFCEKIKASFFFLPFVFQLTNPLYCNHTARLQHRSKQFVSQSSLPNSAEEKRQTNPEEVLLWKHCAE